MASESPEPSDSPNSDATANRDGKSDDPGQRSAGGNQKQDGERTGEKKTVVSDFHARKLKERRELWRFDRRVATISLGTVAAFLLLAVTSYFYHAGNAADTFLTKAQEAATDGKIDAQIGWLSRYLLVRPDDTRRMIEIAEIADQAAENAALEEQRSRTEIARRRMMDTINGLGDELPAEQSRLRKHLIRRLLQLGGKFYREAERQVVLLDAPKEDPLANKALVLALSGQFASSTYSNRDAALFDEAKDYWNWLVNQPAGVVYRKGVETNLDDLEVLSAFLNLVRDEPKQFRLPGGDKSAEKQALAQATFEQEVGALTSSVLERVSEMKSPRAKLVLYNYRQKGSEAERKSAVKLLLQSAVVAAERLEMTDPTTTDRSKEERRPISSEDLALGTGAPDSYWDYLTVLEAARFQSASERLARQLGQESDVDMERVSHWYDVLMDFDHGELNARIRQNTFLSAGFFARLDGDTDKAIELWQRGLQEVNLDNIELLGVLVTEVSAKQERSNTDVQLANKSLQDLRSAVARKKTELRELSIQELTDAERTAILRTVEIAAWRASVSEAILRRTNEYVAPESDEDDGRDPDEIVIDLLKRALGDPAEVGVDERVRVATVLAELFRRTGAWDQAAETLSKACEVMPGNLTLQLQAAEAWTRAGNQLKAIEHWRVAQASDGLPIRVAAAHGTLNYQLRRAPESQDFSTVRQEAVELRERMDAALEASADSPERKEELDASNAYLRILEISIPSPGTTPAEHLASRTVAEQFAALAEDFPSNALLQAYAAERLAAVGIDGAAEEAVERLVALEGKDSSRVAITRARQIALRGQPVAAARELMKFMQEHPKDQAAIDIARIAADFANRADETGLAYEVTVLLPEETRSPKIAYTLYRMATRLGETKKAEQHLAELRTLEGDNGTYWRFIDIENIVLKLSARNTVIERNDSEMNRAQGMLSELIARRPRWGQALALRAWLSVLAGFDERSVDQLRQAIAAGDQRLSTRRLYWSQLMRLKEYAAADEDIKNTAMASGVDLDPYSEMQISVSLGKGDLNEALEEARRAVSNKPDDPISHLIVAKTASIAAISQRQGNSTPEVIAETEKLVDEARDAIKKAIALSGDVDYPILSTQLAIEIAHGDVASVTALEKQLLENDDLGLHYQMVLLGQTSVYLNEMDEAIARYKQADDARPTLQTKLALATLYSRLGRHDQEARILRSAIGLTPRNAEVRERLAEAIISRDGDNVDWAELSKLLTEGNGVNPSNRLLYATMLGSSEDDARLRESLRILRALVLENNSKSYLASLTLGAVLIKVAGRIPETAADRETKQSTFLDEARTLYARNAQSIQASIDDFYRFAVYLLQYGSKDDWDEVDRLAERLDSTEGGILRALELQIILRQKRGQGKSIPKWLDGWAEKSKGKPGAQNNEIDLAAGTALIKLGFAEQGIALFRKVYDSDPSQLFNYVIALTQINRYDEAATVAAEHFGKFEDAQSAMLLVEAILGAEEPRAYSKYSDLLERATKLHERDAPLLDSVATLAMQSGRVRTAITLYHSVLELDPQRLRTLNNLAMAYSQIPNQAVRGLKVIDRALEVVTGPARAELLDTKGTLLMEAKQYERAIEVFDEAIEIRDDPRFHFHKVLVLIRQERLSDATRQWTMLDRKRINTKGLTKEEQSIYSRMLKDYEVRGRQADYEVRSL